MFVDHKIFGTVEPLISDQVRQSEEQKHPCTSSILVGKNAYERNMSIEYVPRKPKIAIIVKLYCLLRLQCKQ